MASAFFLYFFTSLSFLVPKGEKTLDNVLFQSFAITREASRRVLNMRPYDVQLIGLIFLAISSIASTDIRNLDSFEAKFTQIITSNSKNVIEYKGEVFIKKSGKILWKYKTPVTKNVYIDGNFAVVDEPELEQAILTQLESEIDIIKLLNSSKKVDNNTFFTDIDDVKYTIKTSKDDKIQEIKYVDKLENSVVIKFYDVVQNGQIGDDIFKFDIPSYYDVIRK
ncbi:LolA-like outer membrane lipoprotein chaperone [Aliarcobacter butzleri]|uniref:LolA-like outer membrane lipoprotein chaperone n=1 Tax=Aliarcobacter butzleri TaxID=28197 RepID=UPI00125FF375